MTPRIPRLVPLLALSTFFWAHAALAHPGHSIPIDELTRNSATVVEATVTGLASAWNDSHTEILTTVDLRRNALYKGAAPENLRLVLLGGTVGDMTLAVLGQVAFSANERVMLFLGPQWDMSSAPVYGGEHGKFTVTHDTVTNRDFLVNEGATVLKTDALSAVRRTNAARPATDR